jgi:hypothetical protein
MAGEFVPQVIGTKNCDGPIVGEAHPNFDYIHRSTTGDDDYPSDACPRYLQVNGKFDALQVTGNIATATLAATGSVSSNGGAHVLSNKKNLPFDMPHPNKEGWRLRHVCIEGPEIAVYCRGKVSSDGIINLPSFWEGLVNPEDMTINLTPIGCWQELFVKEIRWGKQIVVQNNASGPINADYHIIARRLDDDLVVEYEGKTHEDYPGGNEGYAFNFEHNYVKNLIQETIREHLDTAS